MSSRRTLRIAPELCIAATGCRECVISCPDKMLRVVDGLPRTVHGAVCEVTDDCRVSCAEDCPTGAATVKEECE